MLGIGIGLLVQACGYAIASNGDTSRGLDLFFAGIAMAFFSCAWRLLGLGASRTERLRVSLLLGLAAVASTYLASPLIYDHTFDSALHQTTYWQLGSLRSLFSLNTTLPVSTHYPALELLTLAVKWSTGLPVVVCDLIVVGMCRFVLIGVLFLFCERVTHSARAAGVAVVVYACSPEFYLYNTAYTYQTIALALGASAIYFLLLATQGVHARRNTALSIGCVAGVTVSHHLIGWLTVSLIVVWAVVLMIEARRASEPIDAEGVSKARLVRNVALVSVMISAVWTATAAPVLFAYLGPILSEAWDGLLGLLNGSSKKRALFHDQGFVTPRWQEILVVVSVLISVALTLASSWSVLRRRTSLTGAQALLPVGVALSLGIVLLAPLTGGSAFVGQRMSTFVFFGIALVSGAWSLTWKRRPPLGVLTAIATVFFIGSLIFGSGPSWTYVRGPYVPAGDQRAFNSPSIAAAQWAGSHLPMESIAISDRDNTVLMSDLGHLEPLTTSGNGVNAGWVFFTSKFTSFDVGFVRQYRVRYIVVDRRLLEGPPAFGVYFDNGSPAPGTANRLTNADLEKFATDPDLQVIYDNGPIRIYDTARLLGTTTPATSRPPIGNAGSGPSLLVLIVFAALSGLWLVRRIVRGSWPRIESVLPGLVAAMVAAIAVMFALVPSGLDPTALGLALLGVLVAIPASRMVHARIRRSSGRHLRRPRRQSHLGGRAGGSSKPRRAEQARGLAGAAVLMVALAMSIASARSDAAPVTALSVTQAGARHPVATATFASASNSPAYLEIRVAGATEWIHRLGKAQVQRVALPAPSSDGDESVDLVMGARVLREVTL